jgi:2-polyprenyl-6-methoxyphenol hydroxylase-like FAD-dependent oxidoreductase
MSTASKRWEAEVLVVGAGPVGLSMACELRRHGVGCRIIDANEGPMDQSRALALQARTLEVLRDMGVIDQALAQGKRVHGLNAYHDGRRIAHVGFDFDDLDPPYPFILVLPQGQTERLLIEHLSGLGGAVERRSKLTALSQDETGVSAKIADASGQERTVHAGWLVGCDGAHSVVRHQLGLPFEGAEYPETFFLADLQLDWNLPDDEAQMFLIPGGVLGAFPFPEPGHWRVVDSSGAVATDEPDAALKQVQALLDAHGPKGAVVHDPTWVSLFRFHRRIVPEFRVGRCFVAGDAAHIHSPAGGQGLNTGVQDGHNLAWKLALVLKGFARESLLDSYTAERQPIAEGVLRGTDLATRVVTLRNPVAEYLRNHLASFLSEFEFVRRRLSRGLSELGVNYRKSSIVAEDRSPLAKALRSDHHAGDAPSAGLTDYRDFGAAPHPGDRVPDVLFETPGEPGPRRLFDVLRDPGHILLLFEGAERDPQHFEPIGALIRSRYADRITAYLVAHPGRPSEGLPWEGPVLLDGNGALHQHFGARAGCLYLIRPDRYLGYRAQPPDAGKLRAYLERVFIESPVG